MIKQPSANLCHKTSNPAIDKPELNTPTINAPNKDPIIVPLPPNSEVPPITTEFECEKSEKKYKF